MYIVTIIPIKKGLQKENLTYFSANNIALGTIVTVPVRSKKIEALVIGVEDAKVLKTDLKNREYQLKKIVGIKGRAPFTKEFFTACQILGDYFIGSTGSIIGNLFPKIFLENIRDLKEKNSSEIENRKENVKHEKLIFQANFEDRAAFYRTLIREAFAKKQSVYICVPTKYDIKEWEGALVKGIEQYLFTFYSEMTKKSLISAYNGVLNTKHPVIIIGTGVFLSIPRRDIGTIILERESGDGYKQLSKPYIDIRTFVEIFSGIEKTKLIFGDTLLRPETLYRHDQGELGEVSSPSYRLLQLENETVVDVKKENNIDSKTKIFSVLSEKAKKQVEQNITIDKSTFLFSLRKGLAPITVCHDCGHTLLCPNCSAPMVLYGAKQRTSTKIEQTRIFMCNKCGHRETTGVKCKECSSWNLTPIGIGTDRVYEEVRELFPKTHIIQIDKESVANDKEARVLVENFYKKPGSILIGTEMAFSYLDSMVDSSIIVSLDGLLSIPSFNITQKILHIIERLTRRTSGTLIIQTRMPENEILRYINSGNVLPLYREDLADRKKFGYPPFKRLIKITFAGTASETEKAREYISNALGKYEPQIFSAFIGKVKGQYVTNTVLKIDPNDWRLPEKDKSKNLELQNILFSLPPQFAVNVDPEDLL